MPTASHLIEETKRASPEGREFTRTNEVEEAKITGKHEQE
jgi:hypothetical protein